MACTYMASWTLVYHKSSYEYRWKGFSVVVCYRRTVETWTYACTVDDSSDEPPAPTAPTGSQLESYEFRRVLGQPLSKAGEAIFYKRGAWEAVS